MKKQSRTVPRRRQSVSPTPRHLPLVDILIDTQAELQELVVASGLKVLEAMLEEDRAAVCGPRYAHQPARQAYRTGHTPSQAVWTGGRCDSSAIVRRCAKPKRFRCQRPCIRDDADLDLNRRVVDQILIALATRQSCAESGTRSARRQALLHESSLARTMPTDRILTGRCDTTLVDRGRSSDSGSHSRGRPHSPARLGSGREGHRR